METTGGRRPGRPRQGAEAISERLALRVTPSQAAELRAAAGDQPFGTWARETLLAAARRARAEGASD